MNAIIPSISNTEDLPKNPSDSNIFRLHHLFNAFDNHRIIEIEIQKVMGKA